MIRLICLLLIFPVTAFAECTITWDPPIASDNVVEAVIYHNDGSGFVTAGAPVAQPTNTTTCSAQGITEEVGHIGCTFVNSSGSSSTMTTIPFPPSIPGAPINVLISVTP